MDKKQAVSKSGITYLLISSYLWITPTTIINHIVRCLKLT
jgi:hypothetical protein